MTFDDLDDDDQVGIPVATTRSAGCAGSKQRTNATQPTPSTDATTCTSGALLMWPNRPKAQGWAQQPG